jgi:hypothetical protein
MTKYDVTMDPRYANYETWKVTLWLANDQSICFVPGYLDRRTCDAAHAIAISDAPLHVSMRDMREFTENLITSITGTPLVDDASLHGDLLRAALGNVEWREVVQMLI